MSYSLDLRARALRYVAQGGSKAEAARIFQVKRVYAAAPAIFSRLQPYRTIIRHHQKTKTVLKSIRQKYTFQRYGISHRIYAVKLDYSPNHRLHS